MKLKKRMAEKNLTLKSAVNQYLRKALREVEKGKKPRAKVETFALEFKPGIDPNRLNQMVDQLEVEDYARKMNRKNL
jgi:ribosomal protein L1